MSSCVDSACAATPTAYSSYSSLSSSLCSRWASCSSAGSTGVYTASQPGFAGAVGASRTWTGGVYTVTGCEWDGSPWTGGPGGWGPGGVAGGSPWAPWGHGWVWSTYTKTVVSTWTVSSANAAQVTTSANRLVTVAEAVSGSSTTTSTLYQAAATHTAGAAPAGVDLGVRVAGALLGGVVAVAGLL